MTEYKQIENNPFDHILYELSMYVATYSYNTDDVFINNMRVDSHIMHLRNIADFFCANEQNKEMHASFYLKNVLPHLLKGKVLKRIKKYTNGAGSHLDKSRVEANYKQQAMKCFEEAFDVIKPIICEYLDHLEYDVKDEFIDAWLSKDIQKKVNALRLELIIKRIPNIVTTCSFSSYSL